ncbi:hypothetical protein OQJ65_22435 [Vibrio sp. Sgm 22]|uniref:hypothetical protein n=1 Tax=unclassified Vibrio TaxID=2614977 RepID=UPI0022495721|nr:MULTISPECIES: hypothetical protein [unclassified Vibrio]MCX2758889.1 hypothetical protein [Vibrio sp. 14G-20]MCX2778064.1 hypothetical protein [Vibrio sp. Sgm 22]
MISGTVSSILVSLGGSAAILLAFGKLFEKLLIDQVSKRTAANLNQDLAILKSKHTNSLEEFKAKTATVLKERESFGAISTELYQIFFKKRIETYQLLLNWDNEYTKDMLEDFSLALTDAYGDKYFKAYSDLREIIVKNKLYISNDLDIAFQKFRYSAADYIKKADEHEVMSEAHGIEPQEYFSEVSEIYNSFAFGTNDLMEEVIKQISIDVAKIRSRVEVDKA